LLCDDDEVEVIEATLIIVEEIDEADDELDMPQVVVEVVE
jgi:hypothetical protein